MWAHLEGSRCVKVIAVEEVIDEVAVERRRLGQRAEHLQRRVDALRRQQALDLRAGGAGGDEHRVERRGRKHGLHGRVVWAPI